MFSPRKANIFALLLIIFSIIAPVVISLFIYNKPDLNLDNLELILIVTEDLITLLIPILLYCAITRTRLSAIIPHERLSFKNVLYIMLLTFLVWPIIMVVSSLTMLFYPPEVNEYLLEYMDKLPLSLSILAMAIMPAVFEELTFRGIIQTNYRSQGILTAAVVSALFFGLFHMNFYQIGYALVAGIFFSFLVSRTNSIFASIFSHFIINGTQVISAKLSMEIMSAYEKEQMFAAANTTSDSFTSIVMGIFITLVTTPFLYITAKKFVEYNIENYMDYRFSINRNEDDEFTISIEGNEKKGFIDIFFVSYIVFAAIIAIISAYIT